MLIKELFEKAENGVLTYEQFEAAAKAANAKFVDLSGGEYVSKHKYDSDIAAKDSEIGTLNSTITERDTDLGNLKTQLEAAGADATKLQELTTNFTSLQGKYENDMKAYKEQLKKQAYEFAVREYANGKKFTSNAAKRDFVQSMIAKDLKMDKDTILGAEDFAATYSKDNADAFVVETPNPTPTPAQPKPEFVNPTQGGNPSPTDNLSPFHFNFTGVRAKPTES